MSTTIIYVLSPDPARGLSPSDFELKVVRDTCTAIRNRFGIALDVLDGHTVGSVACGPEQEAEIEEAFDLALQSVVDAALAAINVTERMAMKKYLGFGAARPESEPVPVPAAPASDPTVN